MKKRQGRAEGPSSGSGPIDLSNCPFYVVTAVDAPTCLVEDEKPGQARGPLQVLCHDRERIGGPWILSVETDNPHSDILVLAKVVLQAGGCEVAGPTPGCTEVNDGELVFLYMCPQVDFFPPGNDFGIEAFSVLPGVLVGDG